MTRIVKSMEDKYREVSLPSVGLPHPDCLMVKELEDGALEHISVDEV